MSPNDATPTPPAVETTHADLQEKFNTGRFYERAQSGELRQRVVDAKHPSRLRAHQPFCTESQVVEYYDATDRLVAKVHQYKLPWGGLGASGRPDPKVLLWENQLLWAP